MRQKKFPIILICVLFFGCYAVLIESVFAQGFKSGTEPTNFRGVNWGEHIDSLSEMRFVAEESGIKFYIRENDELMIGDAILSFILYGFYKDRFCSISISFKERANFEQIKKTLFITYGEGEKPDEFNEEFKWWGGTVFIILKYNETIKEGQILWYYRPIWEERESDEK